MEQRLTIPWRPVEAVPVALLAAVVALILGAIVRVLVPSSTALLLFGLIFELSLAGATLLWAFAVRRGRARDLGLSTDGWRKQAGAGFLAGLGIFALTAFVLAPLLTLLVALFSSGSVELPRQQVLPSSPGTGEVLLGALPVIIGAPVAEELFFRGFLFGALRARLGFWASAVISGIVFGAFHVIPLLIPLMVVVGIALAYVYERRGSLVAAMAAHAAFNVVGYTFIVRALQ